MTKQTAERWASSPALKLTASNYLPSFGETQATSSLVDTEYERQSDAVDIIKLSGEELGRTDKERRLYVKTIGEKYGQVNFLVRTEDLNTLAAHIKSGEVNIDEQDEEVKSFLKADIADLNRVSKELFGDIDPERYEAIIARTRKSAREILADETADAELQGSAARILEQFPDADESLVDKHIQIPTQELLAHYKPAIEKKYADILELIDNNKAEYTSDELLILFSEQLNVMTTKWGLDNGQTWQVKLGKSNINIDMEERTVWIPKDRTYSTMKVRMLSVHETGGHLLRNLIGEQSDNPLLEAGTPKRSTDEEALFVAYEQMLSGEAVESGLAYYVSVGLGSGALNHPKVPFDVLEEPVLDFLAVTKKRVLTDKERSANIKRVQRITRGMPSIVIDGELHQVTYNADLKYANGQANAIAFLEQNKDNFQALDDVMLGKFAYSDPEQMQYAVEHADHIKGLRVPTAA